MPDSEWWKKAWEQCNDHRNALTDTLREARDEVARLENRVDDLEDRLWGMIERSEG